eukprot:CAMPEP_0171308426 /NCGR_PEP_ID=MMETSP0816-20121228/18580_1 /TAXON_ID=420281 /ORGANISM="Proboscia inermis, Strain CCAP1064/1" /LENGTH=172 /DNA_ID=CAMNT_0011791335 /DNA_START=665 /DNA_END=1183 /DNA_ORIENTATION=-
MSLVAFRFFTCMSSSPSNDRCLSNPTDVLPLVGLMVEALLFGLFTCCMMVDQWDVVMTNVTHIDRLKESKSSYGIPVDSPKKPKGGGINEVFGTGNYKGGYESGFRLDWLFPYAEATFPASMRDEIMGFCRPCGGPIRPPKCIPATSINLSMISSPDNMEMTSLRSSVDHIV